LNDFYELFYTKTGIDLHKYDLTTKIEAVYDGNSLFTKEMRVTPIGMLINKYGDKTETYYEVLEELECIVLNSQINNFRINKVVIYNNYACLPLIIKRNNEEVIQILYEFTKK
jgi:hypothetical protein